MYVGMEAGVGAPIFVPSTTKRSSMRTIVSLNL
jgi:hypothetical protein